MNTASRVESHGARNRIHCSEETANLLKEAGKQNWLMPREDKIHAKGKGEVRRIFFMKNGYNETNFQFVSHSIMQIASNLLGGGPHQKLEQRR